MTCILSSLFPCWTFGLGILFYFFPEILIIAVACCKTVVCDTLKIQMDLDPECTHILICIEASANK